MEILDEGRVAPSGLERQATTPGPDSLKALIQLLVVETPNAPPAVADFVLQSMPLNTLKTRTTSWNKWLRWCKEQRHAPLKPTSMALLQLFKSIVGESPSGRPAGTINNLKALLTFLADLAPARFDLRRPHASHDATWLPPALMQRALQGLVRANTTRPTHKQPFLDMPRILEQLRTSAEPLLAAGGRAADFKPLRDLAIASFAAVVPSRAAEIAGLEQRDVAIYVPTRVLGVAAVSSKLHNLATDYLASLLADANIDFHFVVELRRSKTDSQMAGIPKRLQHAPGAQWSPARLLLACAVASRRRHQQVFGEPRAPLFHEATDPASKPAFSGMANDCPNSVLPATVSRILARVAKLATGATGISARGWRPAAASWLLACGVDKNTVVALGGWSSAQSLRKFYVRHLPIDKQKMATLYGILPSTHDRNSSESSEPASSMSSSRVSAPFESEDEPSDDSDHDAASTSSDSSSSDLSDDSDYEFPAPSVLSSTYQTRSSTNSSAALSAAIAHEADRESHLETARTRARRNRLQ
jgi:integrase